MRPLACSIIIAVLYRQVAGYPEALRPGIAFSAKRLLRFAIILYGLKLNIDIVLHQGLFLLLRDVGTIVFAIVGMILLARRLSRRFRRSCGRMRRIPRLAQGSLR